MAAGDIFAKTALGTHEVTNRKMKLSPRLRTMLILVDGRQPAFLLQEEAGKVGAPPDSLDQLAALNLIEKAGTVAAGVAATAAAASAEDEFMRFRNAKDFMNVTITNALGLKSFFFTLKLERASTRADLGELADAYRAAIEKASGSEEAEVLSTRLSAMLA